MPRDSAPRRTPLAPYSARAVCTRAKSLAAMSFNCKHHVESNDLEPEADVVAHGAKLRRGIGRYTAPRCDGK